VRLRSLHARLIAGAAIWSLGILAATFVLGLAIVTSHPRLRPAVHYWMVTMAAVVLVTAGVSVIRRGLSPFTLLRERLSAVRDGRTARLEGEYPSEVTPLVDDLNALLDDRERRVARAHAKAGDLAHGLKTPLAVLSNEAERLSGAGQTELASTIAQQVERMRRQVDYHLAEARAAASGVTSGVHCLVTESTDALVRTLLTLFADRGLAIEAHVDPRHWVRCHREDLDELLGNLLDNACKWARSQITVSSSIAGDAVAIAVEDDGRGIEVKMRETVLRRGIRADETSPGSGLGLAIVRDLSERYGGSIALDESSLGGLRATLRLPGGQ
jgi:signal transduction histidine kinase